jgi:hypothetical protein
MLRFRLSAIVSRAPTMPRFSTNQKSMKQQTHQLGSDGRTDLSSAGTLTGNGWTEFGLTGTYVGSDHADPPFKPAGGNQGMKKTFHALPRHAHCCAI